MRHPYSTHASSRRPRAPGVTLVLAVVIAAALLGASCGGEPSPRPSAPASPAGHTAPPGSRPLTGSPRRAVAAYWALVDANDYEGLAAASAPGSRAALTAGNDDIARVRLLRVARVRREPGGAQVEADVRIVPASDVTPWGEPGVHTLFISLSRAHGGWIVSAWGTGP